MDDQNGKNDSREIETGETVHLIKHAGESGWAIVSYDWGWAANSPELSLVTATVFASRVEWEKLRFNTQDEAYAFVEEKIRSDKTPGMKSTKPR